MRFATRADVQTLPGLPPSIPRAPESRWQWWASWGSCLVRRLVIGLGSLVVFGVDSPGTWLALVGVGMSYAVESGVLRRHEVLGEGVALLLLGGAGLYGLLLLR